MNFKDNGVGIMQRAVSLGQMIGLGKGDRYVKQLQCGNLHPKAPNWSVILKIVK
jgi:hypothetical protein